MKKLLIILCAAGFLAVSPSLLAAPGNAAAGKLKSNTCAACHGANGISTSDQFPILAGQYPDYILQALKEYKSGQRKNPIMRNFASQLSLQDMKDLAAYFSSLPGPLGTLPKD